MTSYKIVYTLPARTGLARDNFVNVWHFKEIPAYGSFPGLINNFYNSRPTGSTNPVSAYLSPEIAAGSNVILTETYAMPAGLVGPTGPPIDVQHFDMPGIAATTWLPSNVAAALSFHGLYGGVPEHAPGARPRSRLRGRIFLGPLNTTALTDVTSPTWRAELSAGFISDVINAFKVLVSGSANTLAVFSKKDIQLYPVVGGWMDNRPDTQRRRLADAISRTPFSIP